METKYAIISKLLEIRHQPPEWHYFRELTLDNCYRRVDAFAISAWRSNGYRRIAYEIKISHSDFMNEIKQPAKRQAAMDVANEFYFVAPRGVIEKREVPDDCGLIELCGSQLRTSVRVKQRNVESPSMGLIMRMLQHKRTLLDVTDISMFKYAGKDLTLSELDSILEDRIRTLRREIKAELEKEQEEHPLVQAIQKHVQYGWRGVDEIDRLFREKRMGLKESSIDLMIKKMDEFKKELEQVKLDGVDKEFTE